MNNLSSIFYIFLDKKRALLTKISSFPTQNMMGYGYFMEFNQSFFNQSISNLNNRRTANYNESTRPTAHVKTCKL